MLKFVEKFKIRFVALLLCFALLPFEALAYDLNGVSVFLTENVKAPVVGSIGGEWTVIGLARSGADIPESYFQEYYSRAEDYVRQKNGVLHKRKYTEYSRVILALTAIGKNPENVAGYNLLAPLEDFDKTVYQGINGAVWALIALDSNNYPSSNREKFIDFILEKQLEDGGWALSGNEADADVTGMVLTALSNYRESEKVENAVNKALLCMSLKQNEKGGFETAGTESAESNSQMIVALCSLGISVNDERFVKNSNTVTDRLKEYYINGGFKHRLDETDANLMATEQVFYALVALDRFKKGKNSLFDMTVEKTQKHPDVKKLPPMEAKTFDDIKEDAGREKIEALAERNIISGKSENLFEPDATMTRAEFATIVVKGLGLPLNGGKTFSDVTENDWFYDYVNTAYNYGIIKGISENKFNPLGTISRQEGVVMVTRAAKLCGLDTEDVQTEKALLEISDVNQLSGWATDSVAFVIGNGIYNVKSAEIRPLEEVKRNEIAEMLYNLLNVSGLL